LAEAVQATLKAEQGGNVTGAEQASSRVLACMREILLRKTGKWPHHTQMMALLYAALHNDDSLIHQIRTGEVRALCR
jgi:hypothetical protein